MGDYAHRTIQKLNQAGVKPEKGPVKMKKLSLAEKGVRYIVDVDDALSTTVYPIDGVAIREGDKCDKFIASVNDHSGTAAFIELKGGDINQAINQLKSTINNSLFRPFPGPDDRVRARIVTNRGVKSASNIKLEKEKILFRKRYNIELRLVSSMQPDTKIVL